MRRQYKYIRYATTSRFWPTGYRFNIAGFDFDFLSNQAPVEDTIITPFKFIMLKEIEASDRENALAIGTRDSITSSDAYMLITGYSVKLGVSGIREIGDRPGILEIPGNIRLRADEPLDEEKQALAERCRQIQLKDRIEPDFTVLREALRWYGEAVNEYSLLSKYMKLWVALDMWIPKMSGKSFINRSLAAMNTMFPEAETDAVESCIRDLYRVRNDLFHEGSASREIPMAAQILECIVRAILLRKIGLDDERDPPALFVTVESYTYLQAGGSLGWIHPTGAQLAGLDSELDVGDSKHRDGKHLLYSSETGAEIRMRLD